MWTKLEELKGKRVREFPVKVMDSIIEISKDPEASDIFRVIPKPDGIDVTEWAAQRFHRSRLALISNHSEQLATILSANAGMSVDEWEAQLDINTYQVDVASMMADPNMRSFFASAQTLVTSF